MERGSLRLPRFELTRKDELTLSACFSAIEDLVWFRGHFAGLPVLPGAAELLFVRELAMMIPAVGGCGAELTGLDAVKFVRPVTPGMRLRAEISSDADGRSVSFLITSPDGAALFSKGTLLFGKAPHETLPGDAALPELPSVPVLDHERLSAVMPQKEPMLMADALLSYSEAEEQGSVKGTVSFTPAAGKCAAVTEKGQDPALVTENMAQCVCAVMSEWHMSRGLPVPAGLLLGVRGLRLDPALICASRSFITFAESSFFDGTRGVFSCSVSAGGRCAAQGRITAAWLMPSAIRELIEER